VPQQPPIPAPGGRPAAVRSRSPLRTALLALIAVAIIIAGGAYILTHRVATPVPRPSPSALATPTPTPAPTPTPTATPPATPTPTPLPTPTPTAASSASPSAAGQFTDPGHDFAAAFPATPTSASGSETESGITITYTTWEALDPVSGEDYFAIWMPYPPAVNVSNALTSLETGVTNMVTSQGSALISQTTGTYQGYPDDNALISAGGAYEEYRFILAGHDFYAFGVASAENPPPGFSAFVGSVQIYATSGT
jgi:hypothetical protein